MSNFKNNPIIQLILVGIIVVFFMYWLNRCSNQDSNYDSNQDNILKEVKEVETIKQINYKNRFDSLQKELNKKNQTIADFSNKLKASQINFNNFKKSTEYKDKIKEIIETISIDTLASNRLELVNCLEQSNYKDSIIDNSTAAKKDSESQKTELQKIIESQKRVETQLWSTLYNKETELKKVQNKGKIGAGVELNSFNMIQVKAGYNISNKTIINAGYVKDLNNNTNAYSIGIYRIF